MEVKEFAREDGRAADELRPISFELGFTSSPISSVLVSMGRTKVLCTVSLQEGVPKWLEGKGQGWLTAEYSLLPGSSRERVEREAVKGRQSGRTQEIQRLIGRSLRAALDLKMLDGLTLLVDCDVLEADGGTRTASVCGGFVAVAEAVAKLRKDGIIGSDPIKDAVAAVSVGIVSGKTLLDLAYSEDSVAEVDMNVVMTGSGEFVEVQGTGEAAVFSRKQLDEMLDLARAGIERIIKAQKEVLSI